MDWNKIDFFKNKNCYITEWKSVNDETRQIADKIINFLLQDCINKSKKYSPDIRELYVENDGCSFVVDTETIHKTITLKYVLYLVEDTISTDYLVNKIGVNFNSSWDEETQTMNIVGILVNGYPTNQLKENVEHETEHMFEYAVGMKKKVNLYDKVLELQKRGRNDIRAYYVAMALYYTFTHEQDAFKQQFYVYLTNNINIDSFEKALEGFKPYQQMDNIFDAVYDYSDDKETIRAIHELGYKSNAYFKRLYFGYKRFVRKLQNVYNRYTIENKDKLLTKESLLYYNLNCISRQYELSEGISFKEKEKNLPEYKFEYFYY